MNFSDIILVFTATLNALIAGLFYAWSCSVMPGFARLNDREFVSAMQKTNRAIQNPVFFASFLGAPVFLIISTVLSFGANPRFMLLLAATVIHLTGTFGLTMFGNVPMNNALDRFQAENASADDIAFQRKSFESRWRFFNNIRTISSTISVVLTILACLK